MSDLEKPSRADRDIPLWQLLDSPTVDVYVGPERTRWPLPERLLSNRSAVFATAFADSDVETSASEGKSPRRNRKTYTLADEENATFEFLVEYLYSSKIPTPSSEKSIGPLLDLYLLAQKLEMESLAPTVVNSVREFYHSSKSYPGLRRVQYIYANTDEENEMREMMVSAVARQLTVGEKIPAHWATALQRNGQLAVDIIRAIQQWHIEESNVPDARDSSEGRGRKSKGGFSAIERAGDSVGTENSMLTDSAIGLESRDGDREEVKHKPDEQKAVTEGNLAGMKDVAAQAHSNIPPPSLSSSSSPPSSPVLNNLPVRPRRPPAQLHSEQRKKRRRHSSLALHHGSRPRPSPIAEADEDVQARGSLIERMNNVARNAYKRREIVLLGLLWLAYAVFIAAQNAKSAAEDRTTQRG